jgi:hypothetical protein
MKSNDPNRSRRDLFGEAKIRPQTGIVAMAKTV